MSATAITDLADVPEDIKPQDQHQEDCREAAAPRGPRPSPSCWPSSGPSPPSASLLSSFRPEDAIKTTGWWTFLSDPQVTLQNYHDVLFGAGGGQALAPYFVNSFVITLPAVTLSIGIAGRLCAYALSCREVDRDVTSSSSRSSRCRSCPCRWPSSRCSSAS